MGARNEVKQMSKLICIDAATLMERNLPPIQYCVHGLIPQGLVTFSGPAKVGKSLLVLDLARKVSAGEKFWGISPWTQYWMGGRFRSINVAASMQIS